MAIAPVIWADSFGSQDFSAYSIANGSLSVGGGRGGRNAYTLANQELQFVGPTTYSLWIVSYALRLNAGGGTNEVVVSLGGVAIRIEGNTKKLFADIDYGALTSKILRYGSWVHVAVRVYFHASAGTIDIWMDNTLALSLSGLNTGGGPSSAAIATSLGNSWSMSDLIIQASNTATDLPVGDLAVSESIPTGDGVHTQFTPSTGTSHYSLVDEAPPVDTSYVSGTAVGQRDTYVMSDLPASSIAVYGVVAKYRAAKTDAGTGAVAPVLRIGGIDYDGTGQNLSTSYQQYYQAYDVSPATGVAFTAAEVNGLEAGVKRTA